MRQIKLALIGLGYIGKIHLKNCLSLKSAKLVAVADTSKAALKYAQNAGVKSTYNSYEIMLQKEDIDAVIISLPTFLHEKCVKDAADYGADVFLEKPLARNVREGEAIVKCVKEHGIKLMLGYPNRFYKPFIKLKKDLDDGFYGDIQTANAVIIGPGPFLHRTEKGSPKPVPEWWFSKELTGGGALLDLGCHVINLLRWYLGDVENIKCVLGYRFGLEVEDHAASIAKFKSGTIATINVGWFSLKSILKVELFGTADHAIQYRKSPNLIFEALKQLVVGTSEFYQLFKSELEHFVNCLENYEDPSPSAEEGLADLKIIDQAYKNAIF
jgi:predicted dehydrogenase